MNLRHSLLAGAVLVLAAPGYAANVSGRVLTTNGVGIPGIDLDIFDALTGIEVAILDDDTDADGSFDFLVPDGRYLIRFQAAPAQPLVSLQFDDWMLTGLVNWDVTMEIGAVLTGHVQSAGGSPVASADIRLYRFDHEQDVHSPTDETNASGDFSVVVPLGTDLSITVKPPAGNRYLATARIAPAMSANSTVGTIALEDGFIVTGSVMNGAVGVESVNIDAFGPDGSEVPLAHDKTNASGAFSVVLPAGEFELVARPKVEALLAPTRSTSFVVSTDRAVPVMTVGLGRSLSGTVRDDTGAGVSDAVVSVSNGAAIDVAGGTANAAGDYVLVAPAGTYDVTARAPAFRGLSAKTIPFVDIDGPTTLDVVLSPPTPIEDLTVSVSWFGGRAVEAVWQVRNLQRYAGFRLLRASGRGATPSPLFVDIATPFVQPNDVTFSGTASQGRFAYVDREPPLHPFYTIEALLVDGTTERFGPYDPGVMVVAAAPAPRRLRVSPNPWSSAVRVAVNLPDGGVPDALRVFDATGRRVLDLRDAGHATAGGWVWEPGVFRGLAPGHYFLDLRQGGQRITGDMIKLP